MQIGFFVDDFHGAPSQHIGGADHQRITDVVGKLQRLCLVARGAVGRLFESQRVDQALEALPVFSQVDGIRAGADDRRAGCFQIPCQLQRGLSAVLNDDTVRLLQLDDLQHVLQGERLEVKPIGGVVIRGYGLGVAVDHDALETVLPRRQRCVNAAVVELNALPDAVRSAAENHDFFPAVGLRFALLFVGGVKISRGGRKLGGARVHPFVNWTQTERVPVLPNGGFAFPEQRADTLVGEAPALELV